MALSSTFRLGDWIWWYYTGYKAHVTVLSLRDKQMTCYVRLPGRVLVTLYTPGPMIQLAPQNCWCRPGGLIWNTPRLSYDSLMPSIGHPSSTLMLEYYEIEKKKSIISMENMYFSATQSHEQEATSRLCSFESDSNLAALCIILCEKGQRPKGWLCKWTNLHHYVSG